MIYIDKLKTFPVTLKKLSDPVRKKVVKNTKYNTDKQIVNKKFWDVGKKVPYLYGLVITTVLNTKIAEVKNEIPAISGLVTAIILNTKIGEVENKIPSVIDLVRKQVITLKYQILRQNILLLLVIINLQVKYLMLGSKKRDKLINQICEFIDYSDLDKKITH